MSHENPIKIDPEIMQGTPCFAGTRVPITILFDYLSDNRTLDYFLDQFPTVERKQAIAVIEAAANILSQPLQSSKVA